MKWRSKAFALRAITTIFSTQGRDSHRYPTYSHRVVAERVYAFAALNAFLFYIRYILTFRAELLQAYAIWYVLVCPISAFRNRSRLKIIKYVQHTLAGDLHVLQWTHKAKMAVFFFLFTCSTEPFMALVRISGDQSATRTATLTKLTCALPFTLFSFVLIEAMSDY